jgi:hypothetical protein
MPEFETMREKHRKDTMISISFFILFILLFAFHSFYIARVNRIMADPDAISNIFKESWGIFFITLLGPVASYVVGLLTIAKRDLYYSIDDLIFGRRKAVDKYICQRMLQFKIPLTSTQSVALAKLKGSLGEDTKRKGVMSLFYRYIEKPDIVNPQLKSHAFTYWGDYFSSMMFAAFGAIALVIVTTIALVDHSWSWLRTGIIILFAFLILLNLHEIIRGKTAKKQFEIPEIQTNEIHRHAGQPLLQELESEGYFLENR